MFTHKLESPLAAETEQRPEQRPEQRSGKPTDRLAEHRDKYNDPRAKITRRGLLIGLGVVVLAMVGAAVSITGRRTQVQKTTEFWGPETVLALQLAERFELIPIDSVPLTESQTQSEIKVIELTAMPGLGLLRRALLEQRSYDWSTEADLPLEARIAKQNLDSDEKPQFIRLRLTDPTANRFSTIELELDLTSGWIGTANGSKSVRIAERSRPKLRNFFSTILHAELQRYDFRD